MNAIRAFLSQPLTERLGWALVHFLWQGTVLALLLGIALWLLRRRSANLRYLVGCAALLLMAACPAATFLALPGAEPAPAPSVEETGEATQRGNGTRAAAQTGCNG